MGTPQKTLAELTETPQYGFTASSSIEPIGPKLVRITDIQDGAINWDSVPYCQCQESDKYLLKPNDILFARTGATTGKTYLVKETPFAIFASYLIRIRPKSDINPAYLYSFFQSNLYWSQIAVEKEGSAQPNVNGKKLSSVEMPIVNSTLQSAIAAFLQVVRDRQDGSKEPLPELPHPLSEQRRIVARIEELAAKIEEAKMLLEIARVKIFSKGSVNGWELKKLDEVAPINMGQSPPGHSYNNIEEGILLLNGPTEFGEQYPKGVQWTTSPTKVCEKGDILLCVRGATTGRMNWADKEYCIGRGLAALTANPEVCLSEYVYQFVVTQTQQMLALAAGSTFPNLPGAKLKSLDIPIPPLPEQRRIVAYLDELQAKVDALRRLQTETGTELGCAAADCAGQGV